MKKEKIIEANIDFFDKFSVIYNKRRRERFENDYARRIVSEYEKVLNEKPFPVMDFLDIGCGVGKVMLNLKLAGAVQNVYGIDISQGMLKECSNNAGKLGIKTHLLQGDVELMPYHNNSFDMVIGHAFLHHIPEVELVFSEVFRILKPGGICIFTEPSKIGSRITLTVQRTIWFLPWIIKKKIFRKPDHIEIDIHTFSSNDLESLASKTGFKKVCTEPYAGFISRIFYWAIDPLVQRVQFSPLLRFFDFVTNLLHGLDEKILKRFIPKDWFDEIAIIAQKESL